MSFSVANIQKRTAQPPKAAADPQEKKKKFKNGEINFIKHEIKKMNKNRLQSSGSGIHGKNSKVRRLPAFFPGVLA